MLVPFLDFHVETIREILSSQVVSAVEMHKVNIGVDDDDVVERCADQMKDNADDEGRIEDDSIVVGRMLAVELGSAADGGVDAAAALSRQEGNSQHFE